MIEVLYWTLAAISIGVSVWLLYREWHQSETLDQRMVNCDETLLSDSRVRVTQMVVLPVGTVVIPDAQPVLYAPNYR